MPDLGMALHIRVESARDYGGFVALVCVDKRGVVESATTPLEWTIGRCWWDLRQNHPDWELGSALDEDDEDDEGYGLA